MVKRAPGGDQPGHPLPRTLCPAARRKAKPALPPDAGR